MGKDPLKQTVHGKGQGCGGLKMFKMSSFGTRLGSFKANSSQKALA